MKVHRHTDGLDYDCLASGSCDGNCGYEPEKRMSELARNEYMPEPPEFQRLRAAVETYRRTADYMPLVRAAENLLQAFEATRMVASTMLARMGGGGAFVGAPNGMMTYRPNAHPPSTVEGDTP